MISNKDIEDLKGLCHRVYVDGNTRGSELLRQFIQDWEHTNRLLEPRPPNETEILDILKLRAEVASLKLENARLRKRIGQLTHGYEEDENPYSKFAKRFNDEEQSEAERQDLREQIYRMKDELNAQKEKARIEMKKQLDKIMYEKDMRRLKDVNTWLGENEDFS